MSRKLNKRLVRRWITVSLVLSVTAIAGLVISSRLGVGGSELLASSSYTAEQVAQGKQYFEVNCASCHGVTGAGNAREGVPALNGSMHAWHHPDSQIAGLIRNGGIVMPAVGPDWSDKQIIDVLAYIKEWWTPEQRATQARISSASPF